MLIRANDVPQFRAKSTAQKNLSHGRFFWCLHHWRVRLKALIPQKLHLQQNTSATLLLLESSAAEKLHVNIRTFKRAQWNRFASYLIVGVDWYISKFLSDGHGFAQDNWASSTCEKIVDPMPLNGSTSIKAISMQISTAIRNKYHHKVTENQT